MGDHVRLFAEGGPDPHLDADAPGKIPPAMVAIGIGISGVGADHFPGVGNMVAIGIGISGPNRPANIEPSRIP